MTAPLLTASATITCPHGGQGTITPAQTAVTAGTPVCTNADQVVIAGCPFTIGTTPSPCLTVQWLTASTACTAGGNAPLTGSSIGLCLSGANVPQGPAVLVPAQTAAAVT